jgi:hypothetical protein
LFNPVVPPSVCRHRIADLPTSKEVACKDDKKRSFWMVAPYILWLKEQLAAEKKKKKAGKAGRGDKADKEAVPLAGDGGDMGGPSSSSTAGGPRGGKDVTGGKDLSATAALLAALSGVMSADAPPSAVAQSPAVGTPVVASPAARRGKKQEAMVGAPLGICPVPPLGISPGISSTSTNLNTPARRGAKKAQANGASAPGIRVLTRSGGASERRGEGGGGAAAAQGHPFLDFAFDAQAVLRALG